MSKFLEIHKCKQCYFLTVDINLTKHLCKMADGKVVENVMVIPDFCPLKNAE